METMTPEGKIGELKHTSHGWVRLLDWDEKTRILRVRVEDKLSPLNGTIIILELLGNDGPSN